MCEERGISVGHRWGKKLLPSFREMRHEVVDDHHSGKASFETMTEQHHVHEKAIECAQAASHKYPGMAQQLMISVKAELVPLIQDLQLVGPLFKQTLSAFWRLVSRSHTWIASLKMRLGTSMQALFEDFWTA